MSKNHEIKSAAGSGRFPESADRVLSVEGVMEVARAILWPDPRNERQESLRTISASANPKKRRSL